MNMIRIGPASSVPRIRNSVESAWIRFCFAKNVNPTTTGNRHTNNKRSYLNKGPNVARPMKNFE